VVTWDSRPRTAVRGSNMKTYLRKIVAFINDEEAAAAMEYTLLCVMVSLAIIAVAATLSPKIAAVFTVVDTAMVAP
jgi:Flp pilus assembly pilin Flp